MKSKLGCIAIFTLLLSCQKDECYQCTWEYRKSIDWYDENDVPPSIQVDSLWSGWEQNFILSLDPNTDGDMFLNLCMQNEDTLFKNGGLYEQSRNAELNFVECEYAKPGLFGF